MWECPKCRQTVEDNFPACWNCGTAPDGTEAPAFQAADNDPDRAERTFSDEESNPYAPPSNVGSKRDPEGGPKAVEMIRALALVSGFAAAILGLQFCMTLNTYLTPREPIGPLAQLADHAFWEEVLPLANGGLAFGFAAISVLLLRYAIVLRALQADPDTTIDQLLGALSTFWDRIGFVVVGALLFGGFLPACLLMLMR